jgi:hypothetical protein
MLPLGVPTQLPLTQTSPDVQAWPSLHGLVLLTFTHPEAGLQESLVQPLPSLQLGGGPPTQLPPEQVSLVVQALPSLQGFELFAYTQPSPESQNSSVHPFPSLQFSGGPGMQLPPEHVSVVVQALLSLQGSELSA